MSGWKNEWFAFSLQTNNAFKYQEADIKSFTTSVTQDMRLKYIYPFKTFSWLFILCEVILRFQIQILDSISFFILLVKSNFTCLRSTWWTTLCDKRIKETLQMQAANLEHCQRPGSLHSCLLSSWKQKENSFLPIILISNCPNYHLFEYLALRTKLLIVWVTELLFL